MDQATKLAIEKVEGKIDSVQEQTKRHDERFEAAWKENRMRIERLEHWRTSRDAWTAAIVGFATLLATAGATLINHYWK